MPISMRHLLASSAVAGLLVLLPVGDANAQDNRNTWDWGASGGVVLSFIAGGASLLLLQRALKGKRDDETVEPTLAKLNRSVEAVDTKLENVLNNVKGLTSTSESGIDLENAMEIASASVGKTLEQHITKVIERTIEKKEENQTNQCTSDPDQAQAIEIYNNQPRSIIIDTNATIDGRIFALLESDLLEELRGQIIIAECMKNELETLEPELRANGFENLFSFQNKDKGRIDQNNYESKITDARLLQLTSDADKELLKDISDTDKKLFLLTSDTNGILVTHDRSLAGLCRNKNVRALNLDELNKITNKPPEIKLPGTKPQFEIGQEIDVELDKSDANPNDAISRSFGPIIVVKDAAPLVGQKERVPVVIERFGGKKGTTPIAKLLSSPDRESPTPEEEE